LLLGKHELVEKMMGVNVLCRLPSARVDPQAYPS
jgi:hypothetical protein